MHKFSHYNKEGKPVHINEAPKGGAWTTALFLLIGSAIASFLIIGGFYLIEVDMKDIKQQEYERT